jgi:AsmA-like protein
MTLSGQGRSASAIAGALSGSGTVTLEAARIPGLDPRAFDVVIRTSDAGQVIDDAKLHKLVEPALTGGTLLVASAQVPFTIKDGRLRVDATALNGEGVRAIVSGGYDIPADQADIRARLVVANTAQASPPEIQIFAAGPPDALHRTVDVAAFSSWLAVRAIDRETRRLDSIERGDATPASIPSPGQSLLVAPETVPGLQPSPDLRRQAPKPRLGAPRTAIAPPAPNAPVTNAAPAANNAAASTPVASQQAPPLPPPIEVRPVPSVARVSPKPKPPLVITPPAASAPSAY